MKPKQSNAEMFLRSLGHALVVIACAVGVVAVLIGVLVGFVALMVFHPWAAGGLIAVTGTVLLALSNFMDRKDGLYP